ncbi:MAG: nucleotide sugar dehydrogenase [Bdellovibrionaceae bacterium]|nr:nucleotide sugar dehydrogenase [Pseudobdellovibrionaceae bacterium]
MQEIQKNIQQNSQERKVAVIGLGYVGLPLAVVLAKKMPVVGFDISLDRIQELEKNLDRTKEVDSSDLMATKIKYTCAIHEMADCDFFIVTVPTPVNVSRQPDLTPLEKATETVAQVLKKGDIVVYESTVYPGCTEEICVPILEKGSGLKFNQDFFCGYSPERINPGDKERTISKIRKVVSGSTPQTLETVDRVYTSVITAGTFRASSIKVAEAAKVIENSQRDINIAFVNELSLIFNRLGLDTREVLEAAATKWNFLNFYPGLVGGHCIGVDPYYLTYKAESMGYHPQVILAGRRINDNMGVHVAGQVIKLMIKKNLTVNNAKVLVLGITFKENCPDVRNSRVIDVIQELKAFGCQVDVYDPQALSQDVFHEYGIAPASIECCAHLHEYTAVVLAVAHQEFKALKWSTIDSKKQVVFDVKGLLPREIVDGRL